MRFKAKFEYFTLLLSNAPALFGAGLLTFDFPFWLSHHQLRLEHSFAYSEYWSLPFVTCSMMVGFFRELPHYFELHQSGLFIRQGWRKRLIAYSSIDKILPVSRPHDWFSPNRILLILDRGDAVQIAVTEKDRFISEISGMCSSLEQRETSFGLSLQRAVA